jgi:sulfoquinovosidase
MSCRVVHPAVALAVLAASVCACGDGDPPPPVTAELAGFQVEVYPEPARLVVRDGERIVYDGRPGQAAAEGAPPHGFAAFRRGNADVQFNFGSFRIEENSRERWQAVVALDVALADGAFDLVLRGEGGARLGAGSITAGRDGQLVVELVADDPTLDRAAVAYGCAPDEHFVGFGGQSFDVDHRGQTVPLWVQEDGIGKAPTDDYDGSWILIGRRHSTHTPMPIYLSSAGHAVALDTSRRAEFAMCSEAEDVIRVEAWEGRILLHLFRGPTPLEAIDRLTAWTGRPALPPRFTFAPWLDAIYGEANVLRVAQKLRAEGVPSSVIWSEDWRGAADEAFGYTLEEDWRVDRDLYPGFETLADDLHALGFKFFIYHNTFIDEHADIRAEALAAGYSIHDGGGAPYEFTGVKFRPSTLLDLTNPDAVAWAKAIYREGLELGADGWMADFAEWLPHDAVLYSGVDPMAHHNLYPVEFQKLNRELFDELEAEDGVERLFFVRSAWLGSQPLVSVVWAGDQQTDFSIGDGMPSIVPMGVGLGVTGFPYYGHDIAGYMSEGTVPVTRELWYRWVTLGALSPVMRTHHGRSARDNWHWESDEASTAHFARWARLHMQLLPYLLGLAERAAATGAPLFRPLALDYPDFAAGWTLTDQFMLGDRLIVAPVMEDGARRRAVTLPPGTFYPLLGGAAVSGGGWNGAGAAPLEEIPVFVPAGTVLVLLPDGVDTAAPATAEGVATLESAGDDRALWLWPGGASRFAEQGLEYRWDGAGVTALPTAATHGDAAVTVVPGDGFVEVAVTGPGTLRFAGGGELEIVGGAGDRSVTVRLFAP